MLKFGKKVTIFTIRKENIEKKERTRMKKVEKRNFQSVKQSRGMSVRRCLIVVGCFCDYGIGNRGDDYGKRFLQTRKDYGYSLRK